MGNVIENTVERTSGIRKQIKPMGRSLKEQIMKTVCHPSPSLCVHFYLQADHSSAVVMALTTTVSCGPAPQSSFIPPFYVFARTLSRYHEEPPLLDITSDAKQPILQLHLRHTSIPSSVCTTLTRPVSTLSFVVIDFIQSAFLSLCSAKLNASVIHKCVFCPSVHHPFWHLHVQS